MLKSRLIPALVAMAFSGSATASGFALQNQTGSGNGNAFAGAAAAAEDAGTIMWNPAGMSFLPKGHNIAVAGTLLYRDIDYSDNGSTALVPALGTTDGGNAGGLSLIPAGYWAYGINDRLSVGVGVSPTFGNVTEYDFDFVGRNAGYFAEIKQININPSIAYRVNDKLSLGFGLNFAHNTTHFKQGLALGALAATTNHLDVEGDDWAMGWNFGAMFQVSPSTRIGLSYRSELTFKLEGDQSASISPVNAATVSQDIKATLKTPASVSIAVSQKLNDRWEMLGDIGWTDWSVVDIIQLKSKATGGNLSALSYNFKDTWRIGFGANYQYSDKVKVRFGIAHDKSPVKSAADRTMTLPDSDRTWLSIGAKYQLSPKSSLDVGYTHIFFDKEKTARAVMSGPIAIQTINGEWSNSVDILSLQYNHNF
ncbi:MAG: outer membrane protein transport protein [Pseudomonadota bacterium]